ncbi:MULTISPECIES: DUF1259 domain-containing protein [Bacillus]|uniref:DUF1259 domain-containing protein n=1 Tax=Bacillus TaxID=1386 RepID=UPI0005349444|nr:MULTISPECIES: DUF1259 domain-containing protein [Bacillus]MCO4216354.1 DUF1259 domain-containing protein [Bacillus sp. 10017]MCX2703089.1 DUF1259 domain-containing protein [Bacillus sp. AS_5]WIL49983.1 DUF1259 domain-containing protein [Bacillus bombysepticus]KAB7677164.1 DUF1259 domain-containing protein [Bacillus sp. B1-WWTP-T-0.5-Post-4]KXY26076.1 methyltransferase [Bacillus cereus]
MNNLNVLCEQFAKILNGKSNINQGVCSVSLHRNIKVFVQGRPSTSVIPVGISFESLDQNGNALNFGEIAILQEEIPLFMQSIVQQGIIVSALHNHWLYMKPLIMYIHIQSVEPPLSFAKKLANSFSFLSSYPITDNES